MQPKIRDLERMPARAGFERRPGKGSHRRWFHPVTKRKVTMSGRPGDDARRFQEDAVKDVLEEKKK